MVTVKPNLQRLFALLNDGKVDEARVFVDGERAAHLEDMRRQYEEAQQEHMLMRQIITGALVSGEAPEAEAPPPPNARGEVLAIAAEVARGNNGLAALPAVIRLVAERGVDLQSTKPGTSIGNILSKASDLWERQGPGVYRLKM